MALIEREDLTPPPADIPRRRQVALPDVCSRVHLQQPPSFLAGVLGGTIPLGAISPTDAQLLALALARQLVDHHRALWEAREQLSPCEAEDLPHTTLAHDGLVENIARTTTQGYGMTPPKAQDERCAYVRQIISLFLEEITRG